MNKSFIENSEFDKCLRCAFCKEVCPLYSIKINDSSVARGFVFLAKALKDEKIGLTDEFNYLINQCLLCTSCMGVCPAGVEIDSLIMELRSKFLKKKGMPLMKKIILKGALSNRKILRVGALAADKFRPLIFKKVNGNNTYKMRFPILLENAEERIFPSFKKHSNKELNYPTGSKKKKGKIAYFTGCASQLFYPNISKEMIEVLNYLGFEVIIPKGQECCGLPFFSNGDINTGKKLLRKNIEIFSKIDVDYIVTNCTSCTTILKNMSIKMLEKDLEKEILIVSDKVLEFTELAAKVDFKEIQLSPLDFKVSVHDPCHRHFNKDYRNVVRKFAQKIPQVKFIEMDKSDRCCGGAGSYNLFNYSNSKQIRKQKLNSIKMANPDIIITSCLECKRFLTEGITHEKMEQVVMHPVELLAMSIKENIDSQNLESNSIKIKV